MPPPGRSRSSRFITVETCQRPPRRVSMPRAFTRPAMVRRLVAPPERMSSTTGARSCACRSALRAIAARIGAPPLPARLSAAAPSGLPSRTPRLLATLSGSFVRLEIASRSACATSAVIPTVRSFASGRSTAANFTPLSLRVSRKAWPRPGRARRGRARGARRPVRPRRRSLVPFLRGRPGCRVTQRRPRRARCQACPRPRRAPPPARTARAAARRPPGRTRSLPDPAGGARLPRGLTERRGRPPYRAELIARPSSVYEPSHAASRSIDPSALAELPQIRYMNAKDERRSASLPLARRSAGGLPRSSGGPFWATKTPMPGRSPRVEADEDLLHAARREFSKETGCSRWLGLQFRLLQLRQASGKLVHVWAIEANIDPLLFKAEGRRGKMWVAGSKLVWACGMIGINGGPEARRCDAGTAREYGHDHERGVEPCDRTERPRADRSTSQQACDSANCAARSAGRSSACAERAAAALRGPGSVSSRGKDEPERHRLARPFAIGPTSMLIARTPVAASIAARSARAQGGAAGRGPRRLIGAERGERQRHLWVAEAEARLHQHHGVDHHHRARRGHRQVQREKPGAAAASRDTASWD